MPAEMLLFLLQTRCFYECIGLSKGQRCLELCVTGTDRGRSAGARRLIVRMHMEAINAHVRHSDAWEDAYFMINVRLPFYAALRARRLTRLPPLQMPMEEDPPMEVD